MSNNYKKKFNNDVEKLFNNDLDFEQIKDKIIIDDSQQKISRKEAFNEKYHTHNHNRWALFNWKVLSVTTSILLIFAFTLIYFTKQNKPDYKLSPFNDQLQGVVFGKQTLNEYTSNLDLSTYIDMQYDEKNPIYFYEVDAKGEDNYYTCAYFPTKYLTMLNKNIDKYVNSYLFLEDLNLIDGKLIAAYTYYLIDNNLDNSESIKWYQIPISKEIPNQIKDYTLGLVLGSQDIHFIENKTTKEKININIKIFYRNFYNINTNQFDNTNNKQIFLKDLINTNILLSYSFINNDDITEIIFQGKYKIIDNNIECININDKNIDKIGYYKSELDKIKTNEYIIDNTTYITYNYEDFCNTYLK